MDDRHNPTNRAIAEADVDALLQRYGVAYRCLDAGPFVEATTHRSYRGRGAAPAGCVPLQARDYERLEHLGDAVVQLVVTDYLHERYPGEAEGFLTKLRMRIVSGTSLAALSISAGLTRFTLLSAQAEAERARDRTGVAEDVLEAFCGALFTVAGYAVSRAFLVAVIEEHLDMASVIERLRCGKDRLMQHCLRLLGFRPAVAVVALPNNFFRATVADADGAVIGSGLAASSRDAELEACQAAYDHLLRRGAGSATRGAA